LDSHRTPPIRLFWLLPLLAASQLFVAACGRVGAQAEGIGPMKQTDIVAGPGEASFPERYRVEVRLPMAEAEFVALLRRLNLHYQLCGERGTAIPPPPARQATTVDLTRVSKCYEIDGEVDPARHIGKRYRAFLDDSGRVIYLENAFSYTGP
jgi:hypothetical protein